MTSEIEELKKEAATIKKTIYTTMVSRQTKSEKNVREIKKMRNKRAVLLTVIRQKELNHG